ncbi:unnamed protein product, partial [Heterosigma akashiwo]
MCRNLLKPRRLALGTAFTTWRRRLKEQKNLAAFQRSQAALNRTGKRLSKSRTVAQMPRVNSEKLNPPVRGQTTGTIHDRMMMTTGNLDLEDYTGPRKKEPRTPPQKDAAPVRAWGQEDELPKPQEKKGQASPLLGSVSGPSKSRASSATSQRSSAADGFEQAQLHGEGPYLESIASDQVSGAEEEEV